jgi:hypothetical protein
MAEFWDTSGMSDHTDKFSDFSAVDVELSGFTLLPQACQGIKAGQFAFPVKSVDNFRIRCTIFDRQNIIPCCYSSRSRILSYDMYGIPGTSLLKKKQRRPRRMAKPRPKQNSGASKVIDPFAIVHTNRFSHSKVNGVTTDF